MTLLQARSVRATSCIVALMLGRAIGVFAQTAPRRSSSPSINAEQRAAHALEVARANPLDLSAFLVRMPKGGDLHNHLGGAIYAESWIRAAAEDGLCVDLQKHSFARRADGGSSAQEKSCGEGRTPATQAYRDQHLYDAMVDAFSMRGFVASSGVTGHDHFFEAFSKFSGTSRNHLGEWLDEVATRAAAQNEQYLELMHTPEFTHTAALAREIGWREDLAGLRENLLARGLRSDIAAATAELDTAEALRRQRENCGAADEATSCRVQIRYLCQVLRGFPKEQVFAQTLLCMETVLADARFVGINLVMPEDGYTSMHDYDLHMRIVGFLHELYPQVHISLHAGELAPGLVPYEGLCCHVRLAVEEGHAERIGHGVDLMYEDRPYELLKKMAARHVMVEINLTSNDVILGISGREHPFPIYRKYGVPVGLSTDDEGVSRIDLTHEYVRATETYGLDYVALKKLTRTSLEHSFLPGRSLWTAPDDFSQIAAACERDAPDAEKTSSRCTAYLESSEKARQQWELERRFRVFESQF